MKPIKNPISPQTSTASKLPKKALRMSKLFSAILLSLLLGFVYSCASDNFLQNLRSNTTGVTQKKQTSSQKAKPDTKAKSKQKSSKIAQTDKKSKKAARKARRANKGTDHSTVRAAYQAGELNRVISLTEGADDIDSLYYRAMTRFAMMSYNHRFSSEKIATYREEVLDLLPQVIEKGAGEIQARARLWYAVALDLSYTSFPNKRLAIELFREVQKDEAYREKLYNEALLYSGNLYTRSGNYIRAREYYRALSNTPYPEDLVYGYDEKRFMSVEEAVASAYSRLKLYVDGQHPSYKPTN